MNDDDAQNLPDLDELEPEQWLSRIDRLHDELLEEVVELLDDCDEAIPAIERLEVLFERYNPDRREESERDVLLSVRREAEGLVFYREETSKKPVELEPTASGTWRRDAEADEEAGHEAAARAILQLVPWWSERAFVDKVGRPGAFDDS